MTAPADDAGAVARRIFDVAVAVGGLAVFAPLIVAISLAILLETGRPVLFSHPRLGCNGRPFRMHKFRKFRADCSNRGCAVTVDGDARLTRVGHFLMVTKLDELPQLWNLLKGEMSVVGPRPESLAFADCFSGRFAGLLDYKPGLLGPCQVLFRREGSLYPADEDPERFYREALFPMKAEIDLGYFPRRSLSGDLGWIAIGLLAVVGADRLAGGARRERFVAESIRTTRASHGGLPHGL